MPKGDIMGDFNQAKYIQQFQKENYDRCIFNVPKGKKAIIETHWRSKGYKSLNTYVNDLINRDMGMEQPPAEQNISITNNHGVVMRDNHGEIKIGE